MTLKENSMDNSLPNAKLINSNGSNFLQQHGAKLVALLIWGTVAGSYYIYTNQNNLTLVDSLEQAVEFLSHSLWGPLLFMLLYTLRPLLFFPATILTLLGGFLFGPIGIIYTVIGANASALFAYGIGSYFGQGILDGNEESGLINQYTERLRESSFETVLIMRLVLLPYDLVNYAAGFLKINWKAFLAATLIGSLPGTISVVLFGSSFGTLEALMAGEVALNPAALALSVVLILISIALSRIVKNREANTENMK